ncbi:PKD domain-containing protein [Natrarchaeobius oligotrophus]|uniref:PKD domain-containing protein n=1 Tax=Natrarchaeobius chitinivorans TaxID=1679083 RepID=A0A3N6PKG1_NATCH|nr:PKD domain-containing protein [Natrarchaeobius chitinivorans]RQG99215.1 PKD domain-containing protein [Natrarchaeobius chitinivorans]
MNETRRNVLRSASSISAVLLGASVTSVAQDLPSEWDPDVVYTSGDRVVHDGAIWAARWWTQGDEPGEGEWGPWEYVEDGGFDPEPPEEPTASFSVSESRPTVDESVTFDASDSEGDVESYAWEFDDGTAADGEVVERAFEEAGEHTVSLTVADGDGNADTASRELTVLEDEPDPPDDVVELPEQYFAPYHHMNTVSETTPVEWADEAGTDYFHLAFILGLEDGTPAWDADHDYVVGETEFGDQIRALQERGGQAILSFGGAVGPYLADYYDDPEELADTFGFIIDEYETPYIDIDDEAASSTTNEVRNEALSILQNRRPEVEISYTVRCNSQGVSPSDFDVIVADAIDRGVEIHRLNLMTMNYGSAGEFDDQSVIGTVEGAHEQLSGELPEKSDEEIYAMLGITPMLGLNNTGVVFTPADAEAVLAYAQDNDVGTLAFWSVERDNPGPEEVDPRHSGIDQDPFEFSRTFNQLN